MEINAESRYSQHKSSEGSGAEREKSTSKLGVHFLEMSDLHKETNKKM